jgi:hypothetical protein
MTADEKLLFNIDFWYKGWGFGFTLWRWGIDLQVKAFHREKTVNRGNWPTEE